MSADLAKEIADALYHVMCNYEREGSGPGSRFEGKMVEAVQAELVIRRVHEYRPPGEPLTHFFHCWRFPDHHACAVELIERQQREFDGLLVTNARLERAARDKP